MNGTSRLGERRKSTLHRANSVVGTNIVLQPRRNMGSFSIRFCARPLLTFSAVSPSTNHTLLLWKYSKKRQSCTSKIGIPWSVISHGIGMKGRRVRCRRTSARRSSILSMAQIAFALHPRVEGDSDCEPSLRSRVNV